MDELDIKKIINGFKGQINKIPTPFLRAISEISWVEIFTKIKEEKKLTDSETEALSLETFMFLFGITNPLDFEINIENALTENKNKTKEIVIIIEEQILKPVFQKAKENGWKENKEEINDLKKALLSPSEDLTEEDILLFEAYNEAPERIKDFFRSGELTQKIEKVGQAFNLTNEEKSIVEAVVTISLLTGLDNQKMREYLKERLVNQKEKLSEIAKELEKEILFPLIKSLEDEARSFEKKISSTDSIDIRLPLELQKKFNDLPKDLKWAISEIKVEEQSLALKQKYNINIEQAGFLSSEIYAVLVGYTHPESFPAKVKTFLKTTPENIENIINEINQNIFGGVREKLLSLHKSKDKKVITLEEQTPKMGENVFKKEEKKKEESVGTKTETTEDKNTILANSIFAQKLAGSFKIPKTETSHKDNTKEVTSGQASKIDPYREMPE